MIPINSPFLLISAPPLEPLVIGASVCMSPNSVTDEPIKSPPTSSLLSKAETTPVVTVGAAPKVSGCPIATAKSPTSILSLLPIDIGIKFEATILTNPISVNLSDPIMLASYILPSSKITRTSVESSITWWLVIIRPSFEITTPDPPPADKNSPSSESVPTWTCTIVFVANSAIETISVESTLGITNSFSLIVSVIVIGSGRTISSSSKRPNKNKNPKTIPLERRAEPVTTFRELFFLSVFSSIKSEMYFLCSNNSC